QGASIRAYFASSNGGYTLSDGCWMNNVIRSGSTWVCSAGQPYLAPVPDPADRAVAAPVNPRSSWTVTFTSADVRSAVLRCGGPDIGVLQAVDLSNQVPLGVAHSVSVRVFGSAANADLRADDFLRNCLGLRSTMVRGNTFNRVETKVCVEGMYLTGGAWAAKPLCGNHLGNAATTSRGPSNSM